MAYKKSGQFDATKQELQVILEHFGINKFDFKAAESGIENSTFIVTTGTQKLVLRVYRQDKKTIEEVMLEIEFMETLRGQGLAVPSIIINKNDGKVLKHKNTTGTWMVIAMEYIDGHHPAAYNTDIIEQLAINQAKMHIIGTQFAKNATSEPLLFLSPGEFTDQINDQELTDQKVEALIKRARQFSVMLNKELECGYVHSDYDIENTLFDNSDKLQAILDFDDLVLMPVIVCLSFTLWSVLFETGDISNVDHYVETYTKIRKLTPLEVSLIPRIILFRHYALAALTVLQNEMESSTLSEYERIENILTSMMSQ